MNRYRMWIFIFLYTLALNIGQASGQDNSTQMYYVKLTIEKSAIHNITQLMGDFTNGPNLIVSNLSMTTTCQKEECTCESGYKWSNESCQPGKCSFSETSPKPMCVSDKAVTLTGSLTLNSSYQNCVAEKDADAKACKKDLLRQIKSVYSTLRGFDTFRINFRESTEGLKANFIMKIAGAIEPQQLISKTAKLVQSLNGKITMETRGVVQLKMPTETVPYDSEQRLTCSVTEDLGIEPEWHLKKDTGQNIITNGSHATVTTQKESIVILTHISEFWAGEYICTYTQDKDNIVIVHKASGVLDIALQPTIDISTDPAFPHCTKSSEFQSVTANCEIKRSTEIYNVTWEKKEIVSKIIQKNDSNSYTEIYSAETFISCSSDKPALTCTFTNRLGQKENATIIINIIAGNDTYCEADGIWPVTKAGYTAELKCEGQTGKRQRECANRNNRGEWQEPVESCVNLKVHSVLESALIAGNGFGYLDQNAANVFNRLQLVTNDTQNINTFSNMNASVYVLVSLSNLTSINNKSTQNDILESSSNMLEKSLQHSWDRKKESDKSLAEKYLESVEKLIEATNLTGPDKKKNIMVDKCDKDDKEGCKKKVFNVTVSLDLSDSDTVKTAGFQELVSYMPNKYENFTPNSIMVSATINSPQRKSTKVIIDFELQMPRGRNIELKCVYWDTDKGEWSTDGCEWQGPDEEMRCICEHLSSFTVLMSRVPVEILWMTEITYVGLAVSVLSLIISLVVELIVWSTVVKSYNLYSRHTAHVNISLSLLVADLAFLGSSTPEKISEIWCQVSVLLKHFFYLAMFFWMFCLSSTLLHQLIFPFHNLSKKNYLRCSLVIGYVCPLIIVAVTFITKGKLYYSTETCWLVYNGLMDGSIHTFILPVGIIVFFNVFSMLVVITKLLGAPTNEHTSNINKMAAKTVLRSIILLTPIFGLTWLFGFGVMTLDLTSGTFAYVVNYAFTLLNAFQGLSILLTTCLGDKLTRDTLLNYWNKKPPVSTTESSTKFDSSWKK